MFEKNSRYKNFLIELFLICAVLFLASPTLSEEVFELAQNDPENSSIKERQIVEINKNLKNVIEENQQLVDEQKRLESEIQRLKSENNTNKSQYRKSEVERSNLTNKIKDVRALNRKYSSEIEKLESNIKNLELAKDEYEDKTHALEKRLYQKEREAKQRTHEIKKSTESTKKITQREMETLDLLSKIDIFTETDERLRNDTAKAHYNMGNIFYSKGEYEIAVREYYQAVTLMPDDPDAHYNLAFVSGVYLHDHKTALKHYQMYLYLNPGADDAAFVKEKILHVELMMAGKVQSPLEKRTH